MKSLIFVTKIFTVCALTASLVRAGTQEKDIAQAGDTVFNATLGKRDVRVEFHTVKIKKAEPGFPLALEQYEEISVVRQMGISVGGQDVWIPRSVYADLFNTRRVSIMNENGIFVLLIGGADGSDSYSVHVRFDSTRVISRTVYNTMSPPKVSEKTVYAKTEVIG